MVGQRNKNINLDWNARKSALLIQVTYLWAADCPFNARTRKFSRKYSYVAIEHVRMCIRKSNGEKYEQAMKALIAKLINKLKIESVL